MRVTNTMIANAATRNVLNASYKLMQIQEQMSSGKKVNRASDDPVSMAKILSCRQGLSQATQYMRNIEHADHLLRQADAALDSVGVQLTKARTLAEQMSTGTYTQEQREIVAEEINAIRRQLVQIANTQVNNKYIFAGTGTVKPPFVSNTSPDDIVYSDNSKTNIIGDIYAVSGTGSTQLPVDIPGINMLPTNIPGDNIFQPQPLGPQGPGEGTTDIFRVLQDLEEALLGTGTLPITVPPTTYEDVIADSLEKLRTITEHVESQRAVLGARINVLESTKYYWKDFELTMKDHLTAIEEINFEDVLTELSMRELAYTASLTAASRTVSMPTLVQYLR